ncbi:MAG: FtsX-like permease family protein [Planctomycetota bacterium]
MILAASELTPIFRIVGIVLFVAVLGVAALGVLFSFILTIRRAGVFPLGLRFATSRLINLVAALGVGVGVAAVIIVMSIMNGFISEQTKLIRGSLADLTIQPRAVMDTADGHPRMPGKFAEYQKILEGTPHVKAVAPRFVWAALIFPGENLNKFALARHGSDFIVQIVGIDPVAERKVSNFDQWVAPLASDEPGLTPDERLIFESVTDSSDPFAKLKKPGTLEKESIIVGVSMASNLRLRKGTRVELATLSPQSTREKPSHPNMFFDIAGMYRTKEHDFDVHNAFVTIPAIQKFLSEDQSEFSEIVVKLDDYKNANKARIEIGRNLRKAGLIAPMRLRGIDNPTPEEEAEAYFPEIQTWEEQKSTLLNAVHNERSILGFVVFIVVLVAAFIEFAILSMMVQEKTRDIGILGTLGASGGEILAVFVDVGLAMTLVGTAFGVGMALLVTSNLNEIDSFIELVSGNRIFNPNVYVLKTIPSEVDWTQVSWIIALTLVSGVLASLIPAWRASRLDPANALRYE